MLKIDASLAPKHKIILSWPWVIFKLRTKEKHSYIIGDWLVDLVWMGQ